MTLGAVDFRCIPTTRVKEFIEDYIQANYESVDTNFGKVNPGYSQFSHDTGIPERRIWGIRRLERANVAFDLLDRMLTRLDMIHLWHTPPEKGGFSDYYLTDIPPAPVEPNLEQRRIMYDSAARRYARKWRVPVSDVLHERAIADFAKVLATA